MGTPRALQVAILTWKQDRPISVDLFFTLTEMGFDVETLEALYRP
jgi:hypothetical protein